MTTQATRPAGGVPGVWPFLGWAVIGAGLCLGAISIATIGGFVLVVTIACLAALIRWPASRNASTLGLLCGAGLVPGYVAYLNRGGPGNVCQAITGGQECTQEWNPWPFLAVAVLLVVAGIVAFVLVRRRASRQGR